MAKTTKMNVYDIVAQRLIDALEKGVVPWRRTWGGTTPMNYVSQRPYQGINSLLLFGGYSSPYYLTWKQVKGLGGEVKEDERKKWNLAVFYKSYISENKETGEKETRTVLRYYELYNLEQTTLPPPPKKDNPVCRAAESLMDTYYDAPLVVTAAVDPFYSPLMDTVNLPDRGNFNTSEDYYSTLFHELVHSTGHKKRLDRFQHGYFGSEAYSEEELVAEVGSCMLRAVCGIDSSTLTESNSVGYIQNWHKRLANDPTILKRAITAASKAVKLITGESHG